MALINRNDLQFSYSWTVVSPDDPRVTGTPDSTLLNRSEGYEVLAFINRIATASDWPTKAPALKVERLIKTHLPGDVRSHKNVWAWIVANWSSY